MEHHGKVYGDGETYLRCYNSKGELHRLDGPAVIACGDKGWFVEGKLHRLDGPAYQSSNGTNRWYVDGKLHRLNGPAVERVNMDNEWHVNGVEVTENEYPEAVLMYKCKQVLES